MRVLLLSLPLALALVGCAGESAKSCSAGYFDCGDPAGGPACCSTGTSCCFGFNLCCDETKPHLGVRRSDGAKLCYASLSGVDETWDLLTVCGKPAS